MDFQTWIRIIWQAIESSQGGFDPRDGRNYIPNRQSHVKPLAMATSLLIADELELAIDQVELFATPTMIESFWGPNANLPPGGAQLAHRWQNVSQRRWEADFDIAIWDRWIDAPEGCGRPHIGLESEAYDRWPVEYDLDPEIEAGLNGSWNDYLRDLSKLFTRRCDLGVFIGRVGPCNNDPVETRLDLLQQNIDRLCGQCLQLVDKNFKLFFALIPTARIQPAPIHLGYWDKPTGSQWVLATCP